MDTASNDVSLSTGCLKSSCAAVVIKKAFGETRVSSAGLEENHYDRAPATDAFEKPKQSTLKQ